MSLSYKQLLSIYIYNNTIGYQQPYLPFQNRTPPKYFIDKWSMRNSFIPGVLHDESLSVRVLILTLTLWLCSFKYNLRHMIRAPMLRTSIALSIAFPIQTVGQYCTVTQLKAFDKSMKTSSACYLFANASTGRSTNSVTM